VRATLLALLLASLPAFADPAPAWRRIDSPESLGSLIAATSTDPKPIVLHFWASWCSVCRAEFPQLKVALEQARKLGSRVLLVSIDDESALSHASRLLDEAGIPGERWRLDAPAPEPVAKQLGVEWDGALPATFVYRQGKRRAAILEPLESPERLTRHLAPAR
jgi:thiol-disulfide isomerase/thioredoxin